MRRLVISVLLCLMAVASMASERKSVIVLSMYKQSDAWSRSSLSPTTDLQALHPELDVAHYTLDISVYDTIDKYEGFIHDVIASANGKAPDLMVISGAQTYNVIEDFNKAWPGMRFVLAGDTDYLCDREYVLELFPRDDVRRTPLKELVPDINLTLVQSPLFYDETLDLVQELRPRASEVVFIGGQDFYSREAQIQLRSTVESRGLKYTPITPFDMSFNDFEKYIQGKDLDKTAIVFKSCFVSERRDYYRDNIENIVPVFYMHYMEFKGNHGGIGYVGYSFSKYESVLQETISSVLFKGKEPKDIPFQRIKADVPVVNVDCVKYYGFDRRSIPSYAKQVNVPPTFWEEYKDFIALCSLLIIIIAIISVSLASSRKKRAELARISEALEVANGQLSEAKDKAIRSSALKSLYVQNMGHDVRTPINAIIGFSQLLGLPDGMLTDEEKANYNRYIANNSEMLMLLVDDILNMSDLENNGYSIEMQDSPCNKIAESSIGCVETRVKPEVKLYYTTEVDDNYSVNIDPRRAQQILVNYLTNACKHTDKGEIHVHCSVSERPGKVVFSVADTGHGIDPEMAESIFERFRKLDNVEGHGIGLSICLALSEKMGCEVCLDTTYTGGARFLFIIPAAQ